MSFFEFGRQIETEEDALFFAERKGLISYAPPDCPRCGSVMSFERGKTRRGCEGLWRCRSDKCSRKTMSFFRGTIFDKSKLAPSLVLKLLFCLGLIAFLPLFPKLNAFLPLSINRVLFCPFFFSKRQEPPAKLLLLHFCPFFHSKPKRNYTRFEFSCRCCLHFQACLMLISNPR